MNDVKRGLLAALERNEDDRATRMVLADWLEENGQPEEAERHRKWQQAKQWLMDFCEANNRHDPEDPSYYMDLSYEPLLAKAIEAAENEDYSIRCGNNQGMCDALRSHGEEFWRNISILTGLPVPEEQWGSYGCAC